MKVSVVICIYSPDLYEDFKDAVDSVLSQTYENIEVVAVVDGNEDVYEMVERDYGSEENVVTHLNEENLGLSESRNRGVENATGDIVAFIDDDAVAEPDWVEELIRMYEEKDAVAAGGKMVPIWVDGKPDFLPEEFYWLVGLTHKGYEGGDEVKQVRNTNGSNMSFKRDALQEIGGFDPNLGRKGEKNLQGEETELAARLREEYGEGMWYNPDAKVGHKIFDYRTKKVWLIKRAFWQGYSKRAMSVILSESLDSESDFLGKLVKRFIPGRIKRLFTNPSFAGLKQLFMIFVLTASVGFGYLYGFTKWR